MSKRRRNEIEELDQIDDIAEETPPETPTKPKIPFAVWFDKQVKAGKIRDYQDEALLVFLKKRGLKNMEDEDTYNRAFKNF